MKYGTASSVELMSKDYSISMDEGKKIIIKETNSLSSHKKLESGIQDSPTDKSVANVDLKALREMLIWLRQLDRDSSDDISTISEGLQKFQIAYDIPFSSSFDDITLQKVKKEFNQSLEATEFDSIRELKRNLNRLGFGRMLISNKIGQFGRRKIKEFQSYYGLEVTGGVTLETLLKIDDLLSESLKLNDYDKELPMLKKYLNLLGYGPIKLTEKFGERTERSIRKIQKKHNLPVSGMIDERTKNAVYESVCIAINTPNKRSRSKKYIKEALNRIGFGGIVVSTKLGEYGIQQLKRFQDYYGLEPTGKVDKATLIKIEKILTSPLQLNAYHRDVVTLKENLINLGYGPIRKTKKFGKQTEKKLKEFQRDNGLPASGIADEKTLDLIDEKSKYIERKTYNHTDATLVEAFKHHLVLKNRYKKDDFHKVFSKNKLSFDPEVLVKNEKEKFQFLDFTRFRTVTKKTLRRYFKEIGIFVGKEEQFLNGGIAHGINEIILVLHALLEVERGYKPLHGIPVDRNGRITYVVEKDGSMEKKIPGKTPETYNLVYNIYGIFDGDEDTLEARAKKAFDESWYTLQNSIIEGAKFIKDLYIGDGKTTYYSKVWDLPVDYVTEDNPHVTENDHKWLYGQLQRIHDIYKQLDSYILYLDIPVYKR